jgi:hypothetical protein
VRRLRSKLVNARITSVRGVGYFLADDDGAILNTISEGGDAKPYKYNKN